MNILEKIVEHKKREVESSKELASISDLERSVLFKHDPISFADSIINPSLTGIIAEFKRQSPSKGVINDKASPMEVAKAYQNHGASAISVLTDFNFFGGSVDDILQIRKEIDLPILRKEFIIDEYQVVEAKSIGADAILLIAAILEKREIVALSSLAHSLGLEVLFEIHSEEELDKVLPNLDAVGINNRNLKTFEVDLEHSKSLAKQLPAGFVTVAESGINDPNTINDLKDFGFQGFLIGESFMKSSSPAIAFGEFVSKLQKNGKRH